MRRLRAASIALFIIALLLLGANLLNNRVFSDQTGPVFKMESKTIELSVHDDTQELLRGMTAEDASDGDVTDSIIVEAISPFTGTGHRMVSYAAFDSDNHVTHAKRELIYTDYTASHFNLSKPLSFAMNATNLLDGITVDDCIDGDLTRSIRMMSDKDIDTAHVGNYDARLKVTNSAGDVAYLPVTIEIYDATVHYKRPQLQLTDYVVYVQKGQYFDEEEYLKSIVINGTEYSMTDEAGTYHPSYYETSDEKTISYDDVDIESDVETDVSGYYVVDYTFTDTEFDTGTGSAKLYVVVEEGKGAAQ